MPLLLQKFIQRADLQANREVWYIFGDNEARVEFGGQAREMRGERNALGIATLRAPGKFWQDSGVQWSSRVLDNDFAVPLALLRAGRLADVEHKAPLIFTYLQAKVALFKEYL